MPNRPAAALVLREGDLERLVLMTRYDDPGRAGVAGAGGAAGCRGLLLILSITGSLLAFDQFLVLTKGGPDNSMITVMFAVYNTAFQKFDRGKAAALSVVLLAALVILNTVQFRFLRPKDD